MKTDISLKSNKRINKINNTVIKSNVKLLPIYNHKEHV